MIDTLRATHRGTDARRGKTHGEARQHCTDRRQVEARQHYTDCRQVGCASRHSCTIKISQSHEHVRATGPNKQWDDSNVSFRDSISSGEGSQRTASVNIPMRVVVEK